MIAVSVIVCVRDGAGTLGDALRSAFAENPLEVVVVDDGSRDASAEVARQLGARVFSQPPTGIAAARNRGLAAARGDCIAFLDADDLWPAGRLARLAAPLVADPALEAVCGAQRLFGTGVAPEVRQGRSLGGMLVRATVRSRIGDFDTTIGYADALDWLARAAEVGLTMAFIDDVVLERRVHAGNLTRGPHSERAAAYLGVARAALARRDAARRGA